MFCPGKPILNTLLEVTRYPYSSWTEFAKLRFDMTTTTQSPAEDLVASLQEQVTKLEEDLIEKDDHIAKLNKVLITILVLAIPGTVITILLVKMCVKRRRRRKNEARKDGAKIPDGAIFIPLMDKRCRSEC
jgi:hypothetical protein